MTLFPSTNPPCDCDADVTKETAVIEAVRSGSTKRAKQIHHYRIRDEARFWHWSDQDVVRI